MYKLLHPHHMVFKNNKLQYTFSMARSCKASPILCIMFIHFILIGCINDKSKSDYRNTDTFLTCRNLYIETFHVYKGGALVGDITSFYLTDSVNFRKFIGTCDDDQREWYNYDCNGDSVYIEKIKEKHSSTEKVIVRKSYDLKKLRREHKFE
jgi:hypothetical protein